MCARPALPVLLLSVALAVPGFADSGPWVPAPGEHYSQVGGSVFSSDSWHDSNGDRSPLGGLWEDRALLIHHEVGWLNRLGVVADLPIKSVTDRGDGFTSRTSTGFGDLRLGLRYAVLRGASALAAGLDWQAPMGYSRKFSILGDGRQALTGQVFFGLPLGRFGFAQASLGGSHRYLSITPEDEVPANPARRWATSVVGSADLGVWVGRSVLIGGRYRGRQLVSGQGPEEEQLDADQHLAGPVALYRVDERMDVMAGSWSTAMATNGYHFDQVYVALVLRQTGFNRLQGFAGGTAPGR